MGNSDLVAAIVHYQQCLEKYTKRNNESRMLYCIGKLYQLPVTVEHLEETGVGRTVNALRKANGEVGDAARSLVTKWKEMVAGEDSEQKDTSIKSENTKSHKHESKDKHKDYSSSSSHKESDTKAKYENKEKNSSSSYDEEESQSSQRKEKEETKHRKHEKSDKTHKHKSSKRKHDSDNSEIEENEYDDKRADNRKHKSSKYRTEDNDSDNGNHHKAKKDGNNSHKQKSSKRRYEDSDSEEEYEEEAENGEEEEDIKHKELSESELSDEEIEEVEIKKQASKHHSKHKEERSSELREKSESRDKSKHKSKHKEKKEKKEHLAEDKVKKETSDHKSKEKHSHKEKSKSSSEKKNKDSKSTDKKSKHSSPKHRDSKEHKSEKSSSRSSSTSTKKSMHENGIDSGSGASFAEALGMLMPGSSKTPKKKIAVIHPFPVEKSTKASSSSPDTAKIEPLNLLEKKPEPLALEINVANLLPEITPNYRPLGNFPVDNGQSKGKMTSEDEALSQLMYSKISRTKVYSGNKVIWAKVPSLFDLCTHVLQDNIDALEYTGGVPFSVLKPVIERANPDQLFMLEHHNPYLIEDTDELWQLHCQKEFRNKRREEMETWRDMYMRCLDEREAKLRALTANIKQSQDKSLPVRQTKLAYVDSHSVVKPPRNVARKQAKHGTGAGTDKKPLVTPSSRLSTLATAGAAGLIAVPNPGSRAASSTGGSSAVTKVKKAPLMQKTLALMKNRCFRR